jgi:hypothetical protein
MVAVLVLAGLYAYGNMRQSLAGTGPLAGPTAPPVVGTPSPTPLLETPTATAQPIPVVASTPKPASASTPLPSGRLQAALYPAGNAVGWVWDGGPLHHFGERNLHVGVFEGHTYYGAMQFNLSGIPLGSSINSAELELAGLSSEHLGSGGTWALRLLSMEVDKGWEMGTYDQIRSAEALDTIPPELKPEDLGVRQTNVFTFTGAQLSELERRLEAGLVSFRLDGPTSGADNLFTWDTGYGGEFGTRPVLRIIYQLPATPTPVVVALGTSTPTPANAVTAAALAATATYEATAFGTPTPLPTNMVTATPLVVVTNTPIPGNAATAEWVFTLATAEAFLYGTPTPLPVGYMTATPGPPTPTYAIIAATPTPENALTAAAHVALATQVAETMGTYTPMPANWVTPIIITSTPAPANAATTAHHAAMMTAEAIVHGLTPTPFNMWTATPTPIYVLLSGEIPPVAATPTPTATPATIPSELVGKIAFLSDRAYHINEGTQPPLGETVLPLGEPLVYVVDADGSNLALLTDRWPYDLAVERDAYSADQRFRVFVKDAIIDTGIIEEVKDEDGNLVEVDTPIQVRRPSLFFFDFHYKAEEQITQFGAGIAYEPAWSPAREQVTFVSDDSGNNEIWVINRDGSGALQLTRDGHSWWDKHPSWSPDGSKIVFWSNRTGNRQIWVMHADGNNLYSLSRTGFNDWDPVWIKYTDPPRDPARLE